MMVEESETPGRPDRPLEPPDRRAAGRTEGDLLAERRALRAADSGESGLLRRAEAAEATLQTLERHVLSLQQRLGEAEGERLRIAELLEAERTVVVEREHELRRVKQREYAEQQLRVEAEDRLIGLDRESRSDLQRLARRLSASEREARDLGASLEDVRRQLTETEQAMAGERAAWRRAGGDLEDRVVALEERAEQIQTSLLAERAARESSEALLEAMREGHGRMELLVAETKQIIARLSAALSGRSAAAGMPAAPVAPTLPAAAELEVGAEPEVGEEPEVGAEPEVGEEPELRVASPPGAAAQARGEEMAEALAAAVERLRARAEAAPGSLDAAADGEEQAVGERPGAALASAAGEEPAAGARADAIEAPAAAEERAVAEEPAATPESAAGEESAATEEPAAAEEPMAEGAPPAGGQPAGAAAPTGAGAPVPEQAPHKHSMSLIRRLRNRRKQRRRR